MMEIAEAGMNGSVLIVFVIGILSTALADKLGGGNDGTLL